MAACSKQNAGPRLDLVGGTRYISSDRPTTTPGDTLTFKLYTDVRDQDQRLSHVRIFVTYTPPKNPLLYGVGYDPKADPGQEEFMYLDSAVSTKEFVLQTTFNARTTSGRERWRFEAEDTQGSKVSRSFRLQVRNPDSLRTYHSYTVQLQAPGSSTNRRSFLALLPGLTLPRYTITTNAEAKNLTDVVYAVSKGGIYLAAPNDTIVKHISRWSGRPTEFRAPNLDKAGFDNASTPAALTAAFDSAPALLPTTRTGPLAATKVYAFRTAAPNQKSGLIYVQSISTAPVPAVLLEVRITK